MQHMSHLDIRDLPLGDMGKTGQIPIMIEHQMQLHRPLGPAKPGPVEYLDTQIDDRRIQAHQLILESELPLPPHGLKTTTLQKVEEDQLVEFPRTVFVGISQAGATRGPDPQMGQLPLTASQSATDLPEAVCPPQLTEQHRHKLPPTTKPPAVPLRPGLSDRMVKLRPGKQLQKLAEYATESIHGWTPWGVLGQHAKPLYPGEVYPQTPKT
jgi:hypothetical protein